MDNLDQYQTKTDLDQQPLVSEFSHRRRIATAALVLIAALLLGYAFYTVLLSGTTNSKDEVPVNKLPRDEAVMIEGSNYSTAEKQAIVEARAAATTEQQLVYDQETDTYSTVEVPRENLSAAEKLSIIQQRQSVDETETIEPGSQ
jgi:hypothetical protein